VGKAILKQILLVSIAGVVVTALIGCGGSNSTATLPSNGIPAGPPAIQGIITSINTEGILVEENPQDASGSAKILLKLTGDTRVLRPSGAAADPSDLTKGQMVKAWVTGPVAESYPLQGQAAVIVID